MSISCTCVLMAQRTDAKFGIKGGVNISRFKIDPSTNTDARTGYHVGMLTHIHLNRTFALQPELTYSTQGAVYSNGRKDKVNYVNVPVLVQLMIGEGLRLETGPQIGFLASAKRQVNPADVGIENMFKKTDFSWSVGTGFLTSSGLGVDVRYNIGINDISKTAADVENRVWQIGLFYQFMK
jgi:hypothetical protein